MRYVKCLDCGHEAKLDPEATDFACRNCHQEQRFLHCSNCAAISQISVDKVRWTCANCTNPNGDGTAAHPASAADYTAQLVDGIERQQIQAVERVQMWCLACGTTQSIPESATDLECRNCMANVSFKRCRLCTSAFPVPNKSRAWTCPWCMSQNSGKELVTAKQVGACLVGKGLEPGDANNRILGGLTVIGGRGNPVPFNTIVSIACSSTHVTITPEHPSGPSVCHPMSEVIGLEVAGGEYKTNAGIIGGGSGISGAAKGILMAAAVNKITTRKHVETQAELVTRIATYAFTTDSFLPVEVANILAPINLLAFDHRSQTAPLTKGDLETETHGEILDPQPDRRVVLEANNALTLIDGLERLAKLHNSGALTEEQFETAKNQLLTGL